MSIEISVKSNDLKKTSRVSMNKFVNTLGKTGSLESLEVQNLKSSVVIFSV